MGYVLSATAPPKGVKAEPILLWGAATGEEITDSTGGEDEIVNGGEEGAVVIAAAHAHRAIWCFTRRPWKKPSLWLLPTADNLGLVLDPRVPPASFPSYRRVLDQEEELPGISHQDGAQGNPRAPRIKEILKVGI